MKLQGKKTGTVANFIGYIDQATPIINLPAGNTMLTVRYMDAGVNCYKDYNTIKEFNEDWEDYKPTEPLIKDEKIKKLLGEVVELELAVNELSRRFDEFNKRYVELCREEEE